MWGIQTIAPPPRPPEENYLPVRVGVWVKVRVSFRVEGGATRQLPGGKLAAG